MNKLKQLGWALAMAASLWVISWCSKDPSQAVAAETDTKVATILSASQREVSREQRLISHIGYLTTLQQLWEGADLDELFDGSINLWDEEPMTIYSLVEILNGNNSFQNITPPKTINYDRNWALDSSFAIWYEQIKDTKTWKTISRLNEITGTEHLVPHWLWDTSLKFNYNSTWVIESVDFQRPNIHIDETIHIQRNEWGLVSKLDIGNALKIDNSITIEYHEWSSLPYSLHQTKYWAFDDKTFFAYDVDDNISKIIYAPAISAKAVKNIVRRWWKSVKWAMQAAEMAMMDVLKRTKWLDVVSIQSTNAVPVGTNSVLDASHWAYKNGWSQLQWNGTSLEAMRLQHEDFPVDDKKAITFNY